LEELRESILHHEFLILKTLGFDFYVEHPYPYLLNYMNRLQGTQSLAQTAWSFVNDSLRTTLSLQFEPRVIASGAIYLASKYLKYNLPEGTSNGVSKPWWESLNVKFEDLQGKNGLCRPHVLLTTWRLLEISNQILDLYELSYEKEVSDAVVSERSFGSKETETSLSAKESSSIITDPTAIVPIVVVEPTDTCDHRNGDLTTTKTTTTTTMTTNTTNGNIGGDGIHNTTVTNGNNDSNVGNGILPIVKASNCFSACFHCNLRSLTEKYPIEAITTSETSATVQITSIAEEISNSNGKNGIGTSPVMISSTKIPLASNECQPIKKRRKLTEDLSNTIPCESSSPSSSSSSLSPPKLPQEEYAPDQCISMPKEEEPLESLIDAQSVQDRDPKSPNPFHLGKTSPSIEVEEGEILPNRLEDGMRSVSSSSSAAFITSSAVSHGSLLENSVSLVCESRLDSTDCKDVFGACGGPLSSSASLAGRRFHPY